MKSFEELNNEFLQDKNFDDVEKVKPEDYEKYLEGINEILENDNTNIEALKFKSFILFCQQKFIESIEICDLILKMQPDNIEVLDSKCGNLFQLGRYKECVAICQRILEINPKNEEALRQWESACIMSDDDKLPKPPESVFSKIIKIVISIAVFVALCFYLLNM